MKNLTVFLLLIAISLSCQNKNGHGEEANTALSEDVKVSENSRDTVLERNDPKILDLTRHQLYIDTTRFSGLQQNLKQWQPGQSPTGMAAEYLKEINKDFKPISVDLNDFPSLWVTVRKLGDDFVLYDRCDGDDTRYQILDHSFITYGPHEPDAASIAKLINLDNDKIELLLRTLPFNGTNPNTSLSITKTDIDNVYVMNYSGLTSYVAPLEKILEFDVVVNHCPTQKEIEYNDFDAVE